METGDSTRCTVHHTNTHGEGWLMSPGSKSATRIKLGRVNGRERAGGGEVCRTGKSEVIAASEGRSAMERKGTR